MAEIKAFKGLRYTEKAGGIESLCCPPYDIIGKDEMKTFTERSPYNVIRMELPQSMAENDIYESADKFLRDFVSENILSDDKKESIYIYEMDFDALGNSHSVKGFVSLVKLEEFSKGIVLPHEETLSKAKTDRLNLMKATGANFSQIYSLYMDDNGSVYDLIEKSSKGECDSKFTDDDGVLHKLWCVSDNNVIEKISAMMSEKKLYIADGHHRYETAINYRNYVKENGLVVGTADYVPMMLVNMENDGLVVFPTHRIVRDLKSFDFNSVIEKCSDFFDIIKNLNREKAEIGLEDAYKLGKKAFVMFTGDNNYTLLSLKDINVMKKFMPSASDALCGLDVSVLHTLILERIFGIDKENMANNINLTYTRKADEAIAEVDAKLANCSFLLNPTRVSEIRDVALAGEKMPQKSTYFYPKLTTGLVMNRINK